MQWGNLRRSTRGVAHRQFLKKLRVRKFNTRQWLPRGKPWPMKCDSEVEKKQAGDRMEHRESNCWRENDRGRKQIKEVNRKESADAARRAELSLRSSGTAKAVRNRSQR
eukprot:6180706-Pleurochrysis_carterae.AAC.7